jgi:glycosyltransferase involved in cell wall biosynthesis
VDTGSEVEEGGQPEEIVVNSSEPIVIACIPAYNEEARIAATIVKTAKYVSDVLVCDDASDDSTGEISEALGVKVIRNEVAMGYSMTMSKLLSEALNIGADYIVTLYADGSHDPTEIPRFIEASKKKGVDIAIGRSSTSADSEPEDSNDVKFVDNLVEAKDAVSSDSMTDFRMYSGKALSSLDLDGSVAWDRVKILEKARKRGLRIAEISLQRKVRDQFPKPARSIGEENTTKVDLPFDRILKVLTEHPVLLFVTPGIAALLGSAALYVYTVKQYVEAMYISTPSVLLGTGAGTLGLVLLFGGLLLWGKSRVR